MLLLLTFALLLCTVSISIHIIYIRMIPGQGIAFGSSACEMSRVSSVRVRFVGVGLASVVFEGLDEFVFVGLVDSFVCVELADSLAFVGLAESFVFV